MSNILQIYYNILLPKKITKCQKNIEKNLIIMYTIIVINFTPISTNFFGE